MTSHFVIIVVFLTLLIVEWSRSKRREKQLFDMVSDLEKAIEHLREALTEDFEGNDVVLSLREEKHYSIADRHLMHNVIDEMRREMHMPPADWLNREEERRKFLAIYGPGRSEDIHKHD